MFRKLTYMLLHMYVSDCFTCVVRCHLLKRIHHRTSVVSFLHLASAQISMLISQLKTQHRDNFRWLEVLLLELQIVFRIQTQSIESGS